MQLPCKAARLTWYIKIHEGTRVRGVDLEVVATSAGSIMV